MDKAADRSTLYDGKDRIIYNPMVARRCPRCHKTNSCFTEGGRLQQFDTVVENPRAQRSIICVNCGHKWRGKLTRSERGIE